MTIELILAALRHIMTAGGFFVVSSGLSTETAWEAVTGAVLVLVGFGWSAWRKYARQL